MNSFNFRHQCSPQLTVTIKRGKMVLGKLKFEYRDEDNDTDDEIEPEKWRCIESNCKATILIKEGNLVNGEWTEHSCSSCLRMEIIAHELDGFKFVRLENADASELVWKCENCDYLIKTDEALYLTQPHYKYLHSKMH